VRLRGRRACSLAPAILCGFVAASAILRGVAPFAFVDGFRSGRVVLTFGGGGFVFCAA
jgi:hypothetical protein